MGAVSTIIVDTFLSQNVFHPCRGDGLEACCTSGIRAVSFLSLFFSFFVLMPLPISHGVYLHQHHLAGRGKEAKAPTIFILERRWVRPLKIDRSGAFATVVDDNNRERCDASRCPDATQMVGFGRAVSQACCLPLGCLGV